MRYLIAAAALALAGCGAVAAPITSMPAPATVADKTALDEKPARVLERAYKAVRGAAEAGVDAGAIRGTTAARVARADNEAFSWLGVVRSAYDAGNAATYTEAIEHAKAAIAKIFGGE